MRKTKTKMMKMNIRTNRNGKQKKIYPSFILNLIATNWITYDDSEISKIFSTDGAKEKGQQNIMDRNDIC